jgi:lipoprotein-anchoring transpeptidase ErfK/SrfK
VPIIPVTATPSTAVAPPPAPAIADLSATPLRAAGKDSGEEMKRVQFRLAELGFWVGAVDGHYGLATRQAVWAFQKYAGLERSGVVDSATAAALTAATTRATATATDGTLVEIDKTRQLLFLVENGETIWIFNTSTGSGKDYVEYNQKIPGKVEEGDAITPSGLFAITRERPQGWWDGDLGKIYRPKYFVGGIAIHGMNTVPAYPASHGCVRLSLPAMDFIWDNGLIPKGMPVWVHGVDPP